MRLKTEKGAAPATDPAPSELPERNEFRRFMMLNQALFDDIASGRVRLNNTELRVWAALVARADVHNYVRERPSWLANEYGMSRQNFSKALLSLLEKDMAIRLRDKGSGRHLMISPFHFWKGAAKGHKAAMRIYVHLAKAQPTPSPKGD